MDNSFENNRKDGKLIFFTVILFFVAIIILFILRQIRGVNLWISITLFSIIDIGFLVEQKTFLIQLRIGFAHVYSLLWHRFVKRRQKNRQMRYSGFLRISEQEIIFRHSILPRKSSIFSANLSTTLLRILFEYRFSLPSQQPRSPDALMYCPFCRRMLFIISPFSWQA